jgi:hypothetical protein
MMSKSHEQELEELNKRMVKTQLYIAPFQLAFGLGIFAKVDDAPENLLPFLGNEVIVNALIASGVAAVIWVTIQIVSISRRRKEIYAAQNT